MIGYKNFGDGRVYFVGLALGQQFKSGSGNEIRAAIEVLLNQVRPNKRIIPSAFPVSNEKWGHDGFSFDYSLEKGEPVWISITYTPRWKALVDGSPLSVFNLENMILVNLPPGQHTVSFKYGMTWVGWAGIGLSVLSLAVLVIISLKLKKVVDWLSGFSLRAVFQKIVDEGG